MSDNWILHKNGTQWNHRHDKKILVAILPNLTEPHRGKYLIYHSHPAPGGKFIGQPFESANSMKKARQMAEVHLRHWNDHTKWSSDPDFGK